MRILVIGPNSYIAKHVQKHIAEKHGEWLVDTLSVRDDRWKTFDFSDYNSVLYFASIVHRKETPELMEAYQTVNCDIPVQIAGRLETGTQFLYFSTMAIFGVEGIVGKSVVIDRDTAIAPKSQYGKTKWAAETALRAVAAERKLALAIFRPPMVYGPDCPGNYRTMEKFVLKFHVFPTVINQRSMIHIDELCEQVLACLERREEGVFHPQDEDYVCTLDMVREIAKEHRTKLVLIPLINPFVTIASRFLPVLNKVWGNLVYDKEIDRR